MGLRRRDQAGGLSVGLVVGLVFGVIAALAVVWFMLGQRIAGTGI